MEKNRPILLLFRDSVETILIDFCFELISVSNVGSLCLITLLFVLFIKNRGFEVVVSSALRSIKGVLRLS